MALMTPEPFCTAELWSLLELLPYRVRFEAYDAAQVGTSHQRVGTYRILGKVLLGVVEVLPYRVRFDAYNAAQVGTYPLSSQVPIPSQRVGTYRNLGKAVLSAGAAGVEYKKGLVPRSSEHR